MGLLKGLLEEYDTSKASTRFFFSRNIARITLTKSTKSPKKILKYVILRQLFIENTTQVVSEPRDVITCVTPLMGMAVTLEP